MGCEELHRRQSEKWILTLLWFLRTCHRNIETFGRHLASRMLNIPICAKNSFQSVTAQNPRATALMQRDRVAPWMNCPPSNLPHSAPYSRSSDSTPSFSLHWYSSSSPCHHDPKDWCGCQFFLIYWLPSSLLPWFMSHSLHLSINLTSSDFYF